MIDLLNRAIIGVHNYFDAYFVMVSIFMMLGFTVSRFRSIGLPATGILVIYWVLASNIGLLSGRVLPEIAIAASIVAGVFAGAWRKLLYRFHTRRLPVVRLPAIVFSPFTFLRSSLESFELYLDRRKYRRTYAEELAREEAKKNARGNSGTSSSRKRGSTHRRRDSGQSKQQRSQSSSKQDRADARKEKFKQNRGSGPSQSPPGQEDDYSILGVTQGASKDEIKQAYRKLCLVFHPDRMPDNIKGDADMEKAFNDKIAKINTAYNGLMK